MRTFTRTLSVFLTLLGAAAFTTACGSNDSGDGGNGDIDSGVLLDDGGNPITPDAANPPPPPDIDAGPNTGCTPGGTECSNCIDDDGDGDIDGFDIHCISASDDDESSFETGIPGDNMDMTWQDCFFDGNSGAGDDGCDKYHYCCLLSDPCPDSGFDPATDCVVTQECIDNCAPSAPPGCDCFGCCTICNDANECFDVVVNPAVAPDCDVDATGTPVNCPACTPNQDCGTACEPTGCTLCPGQTEDDLPPECTGGAQCPDGLTPCETTDDCAANYFCSNGCCIQNIG